MKILIESNKNGDLHIKMQGTLKELMVGFTAAIGNLSIKHEVDPSDLAAEIFQAFEVIKDLELTYCIKDHIH